MKTNEYPTYEYLLDHYEEPIIQQRAIYWFRACQKIIAELGLTNKATINNQRLIHMVLSYFADTVRLKMFHETDVTSKMRIFGYSLFWLLRSSPIQLLDKVPENCLFINEKLVVLSFFAEFILPHEVELESKIVSRYLDAFFYFCKYRIYTPQSIELQIASLLFGLGEDPFHAPVEHIFPEINEDVT